METETSIVPVTRLYADDAGNARFEDVEVALLPDPPPPDSTAVSAPMPATAVLFARAGAGTGHDEQPEHQRQLAIGISGSVRITASGETRAFGPGAALLIEDTTGIGHSSETDDGFFAAIVVLPD